MPQAIETAFIEIVGDLSKFNEQLDKGVQKALRQAGEEAERVFNRMESSAREAGQELLEAFGGSISESIRQTDSHVRGVLERMEAVDAASRGIREGFERVAAAVEESTDPAQTLAVEIGELRDLVRQLGGDDALSALEGHFEQLELAVIRLDRRIEDGLTDAINRTGEAAEVFGQRIRAAFGRAIIAGPERLEESLEDVSRTGDREFDRLEQQIEATFEGLGDIPELNRLRTQLNQTAADLRDEFGAASGAAEDALLEAFRSGELSAEQFDEELARLADRLSQDLSNSVSEVHDKLQLLRGDEELFTRIVEEADDLEQALDDIAETSIREVNEEFERVAREIEEARGEALQLNEALDRLDDVKPDLARLFREGQPAIEGVTDAVRFAEREINDLHGEALKLDAALEKLDAIDLDLADEFRRAGPALERVQQAVDEIGDETRQTAGSLALAGGAARNFGRQFRFGRIVAGFNRIRFLMLDLRFVLGGIGAFAAAQFAQFGLEAASAVEQARLSFQVIGRSIEGDLNDSILGFRDVATESLDEVIQFARETPFSLEQVTNAVRRISAFLPSLGVASDEALSTLAGRTEVSIELFEDLGAALSVLGNQDAIDRLVKGLGDVGAAGRLTGEEERQLRNALPGIEIRSAIISGILDPTVESSEAIDTLREEFSNLGATAEEVPQAALQRFVALKERGLIPAEAVVKGLRQSLVNLAGEDAIEAFTFTIEGVIEKVREAAEVGSAVGFEPLAASLAETVLPQLERVEDGAERFAAGLTELFQEIIPIGLDLFGGMTEIGAQAFEGLADIIDRNQGLINEVLSEGGDLVSNFVDALLDVAEAAIPLGPPLIEIADTLIEGFVPILEFVIPLLADMAEVLSTLSFEELTALFAIVKFRAGVVNALAAMTQNIDNLATSALNATARFGALGAAIGLVVAGALRRRYESFFEEGVEGAEDLADSLVDTESGVANLINTLQPAADDLREYAEAQLEMATAAVEGNDALGVLFDGISFLSGADFLQFFGLEGFQGQVDKLELGLRSILNPDIGRGLAGAQTAFTEADRIEDAGQRVDAAFEQVRLRLLRTNTTFNDTALKAAIAGDGLDNLAEEAGLTEQDLLELAEEGVNPVVNALLTGIGGPEAMEEAFSNLGFEVDKVDFDDAIIEVEQLETAFGNAATAISEAREELRKERDPVFAALSAQLGLEEARTALEEVQADAESTDAAELSAVNAFKDAALERIGTAQDLAAFLASEEGVDTSIDEILAGVQTDLLEILPEEEVNLIMGLALGEDAVDTLKGDVARAFEEEGGVPAGQALVGVDEGVDDVIERLNTGRSTVNLLGEDFDRSMGAMSRTAEQAADRIGGEFNDLGPTIGNSGERVQTTMDRSIRNISDRYIEAVNEMEREGGFEGIANNFETAVAPIPRHFDAAGNEAINALERALPGNVGRIGDEAAVEFRFGIGDIPTHARLVGEDAYTDFLVAARPIGEQGDILEGRFVAGLSGLPAQTQVIAINAVGSFTGGMRSQLDAARNAGFQVAAAAEAGFRGGLVIDSPSKVMQGIGFDTIEGFIGGMTDQLPRVASVGQSISDTLQSSVNPALDVGIAQQRSPINVNGSPARLAAAGQSTGLSVNIDKVESPRPEQAGQRVATAITDTLYLNTGRLLQ